MLTTQQASSPVTTSGRLAPSALTLTTMTSSTGFFSRGRTRMLPIHLFCGSLVALAALPKSLSSMRTVPINSMTMALSRSTQTLGTVSAICFMLTSQSELASQRAASMTPDQRMRWPKTWPKCSVVSSNRTQTTLDATSTLLVRAMPAITSPPFLTTFSTPPLMST